MTPLLWSRARIAASIAFTAIAVLCGTASVAADITLAERLRDMADEVEQVEAERDAERDRAEALTRLVAELEQTEAQLRNDVAASGALIEAAAAEIARLRDEITELLATLEGLPPAPPEIRRPSTRLLHWQHVGHSISAENQRTSKYHSNGPQGRLIHRNVATREAGFAPLVARLDDLLPAYEGAIGGVLFHNVGGISEPWYAARAHLPTPANPQGDPASMRFEQVEEAAEHFPSLIETLPDLVAACERHGALALAYIGFPRCDYHPDYAFAPEPEQCASAELDRYYGPLVQAGIAAIGHDWTSALFEHSRVVDVNFRWLREHGVEPMIEANPRRETPWLLGWSAIAEDRMWSQASSRFTPAEVRAAGGLPIIYVRNGTAEERYRRTLELLTAGETVATNCATFISAGLDLQPLIEAAR